MTDKQKLMTNLKYKNVENFLKRGMIDLLEAVNVIDCYYKEGSLEHSQAILAIKLLSKVKTLAEKN